MKYFGLIYFIICLIDIIFIDAYPIGRLVAKPLIASSLLCYYILSLEKQHSFIILGLVFAILGDVFLLFDGDTVFKLGLLSFLLMQLSYINYLRKFAVNKKNSIQKSLIAVIILVAILFNWLFYTKNTSMLPLIMVYSLVLSIMAIYAVLFPSKKSLSIVGLGAVLFVVSDLILGVNKFIQPIYIADYLVMVTYCVAQYLIITGITKDAVKYFNSRKKKVN